MGTAQYIAPEQALGRDATAASDVYSLGVVGYESVAGRRPFTGDGALTVAMKHIKEQPAPLPADIPPNVRELIEISLLKEPGQRYRSGGAFADAVAAVRAGRRPPRPNHAPSIGRATPAAIPSTAQTRAVPDYGRPPTANVRTRPPTGSHRTPPPKRTFSPGQRALLWAAGVLGALAIIIAILMVLNVQDRKDKPAPTTETSTTVVGPSPAPSSATPGAMPPRPDIEWVPAVPSPGVEQTST
jgi:serine/threonine-protein kinase